MGIRFEKLILPKDSVVLPDSRETGKLQSNYRSLKFTYTENGEEKEGSFSINLLGNSNYDIEIIPRLPDTAAMCLLNNFFGQFNQIYNSEIVPYELKKLK